MGRIDGCRLVGSGSIDLIDVPNENQAAEQWKLNADSASVRIGQNVEVCPDFGRKWSRCLAEFRVNDIGILVPVIDGDPHLAM